MTIRPQTPFRAGTDLIPVFATVRAADGHLVTDLGRDDFEILDRGTPVPIAVFSNDVQPITLAILIDMSGGLFDTGRYAVLRNALMRTIDQLTPQDRARIGTFTGSEIAIGFHLTSDHVELRRVIEEEVWPSGGRRHLWNALAAAMASLRNETGRRVVLLVTNGADSMDDIPGWPGAKFVEQSIRDDAFMVYAVSPFPKNQAMFESGGESQSRLSLPDVVEKSGGAYLEASGGGYMRGQPTAASDPLLFALPGVIDELRHQYALGFVPSRRDGREGSIEVRVRRPMTTVAARKSYRAPSR